MVRIPPPPLPFTDRVSISEKISLVWCLIYRLLLSKLQGFYKYIIAESCCSISLIFDFLEKGPIFHFWTAYAVLAMIRVLTRTFVNNHHFVFDFDIVRISRNGKFQFLDEFFVRRHHYSGFMTSAGQSLLFKCENVMIISNK